MTQLEKDFVWGRGRGTDRPSKLAEIMGVRYRFWGKVLGRLQDYLVVQAELTDDEIDRRADLVGSAEQAALEDPLNRKVIFRAPS